jgi:putative DNA primase/helicase
MSAAQWAVRYIERGIAIVPLPPREKKPTHPAWNQDAQLIRTAEAARRYFTGNPDANMGACLEPSGLVSLDADYLDGARQVLAAEGIDLDALTREIPTIIGRAPRLEFKAPDVCLGRKAVIWPPRAEGEKPVTVLEFRAGRLQDVLPPSIHPNTRQPYRWLTPPRDGFPPLPDAILALWRDFERFKHRARNLCPWAPPEPEPEPRVARCDSRPRTGPSVIAAFNDAHDPVAILETHGYERAGKRRWKSPYGHGIAGVVLLPSGKVFCHHASDPLGDEHAHDAFDLFALFEHGGDQRAAVKAAAELLGLNRGGAA